MKNLEFRQLTSDGFIIAVEPPPLDGFPTEAMEVSFATYAGEKVGPIEKVRMVKIYHDSIIIYHIRGGYIEYRFKDLFIKGRGRVLIKSTKDKELWCLDWRPSSTLIVRYGILHNDDANDELVEKEAIVFTGCKHGYEEIIRTEGNSEVSNLCNMLTHYMDHYQKLLGAIKK